MQQLDRSKLIFAGAAALFLGSAANSIASAQVPTPPAAAKPSGFKNLKVFPAEIPRDRLIAIMRGYAEALGVKCTHCHVGEEGKRETMDFASDAKQAKLTARVMMAMNRRLNEDEFKVTDWRNNKIACFTCHRGAVKPLFAPAPAEPPKPS